MKQRLLVGLLCIVFACNAGDSEVARDPGKPLPELTATDLERFAQGQTRFHAPFSPDDGLGPLFNEARCSSCHDLPVVGGTGAEVAVKATRFTPPDACDLLVHQGGDNIQQRATPALQALGIPGEARPSSATELSVVTAPSLFGLGLVELIPEAVITSRADPEDADADGISGRAARLPDGRLGRFGRKADSATLEDFVDTALRFELGLTTYRNPEEETINGVPLPPDTDPAPDPEIDRPTLELLADYIRFLAPPVRAIPESARDSITQGETLFHDLGCADCHTPSMRTGTSDLAAFDRKTIHLYSDMLLHDLGPELRGVCGPVASPTEYRTARLMGLRFRTAYLHDGSAGLLDEAILRHGGEAAQSRGAYSRLNELGKRVLQRFLRSL
jgi:CxxC motif-containing protein (DUF1111 family)